MAYQWEGGFSAIATFSILLQGLIFRRTSAFNAGAVGVQRNQPFDGCRVAQVHRTPDFHIRFPHPRSAGTEAPARAHSRRRVAARIPVADLRPPAGAGGDSLPYTMRLCGWAGVLVLLFFAGFTCYTGKLLGRLMEHTPAVRLRDGPGAYTMYGFHDMGFVAFGEVCVCVCVCVCARARAKPKQKVKTRARPSPRGPAALRQRLPCLIRAGGSASPVNNWATKRRPAGAVYGALSVVLRLSA